ncbi:uncharacterized protein [Hyperolius riggenbachi]|uniref:uncharacterized protein n=1 Tax=Hyperolius riggenbachi TaxID=752182 RepID=UPI0035A339BB
MPALHKIPKSRPTHPWPTTSDQELQPTISPEKKGSNKHVVGIFSRSDRSDYSWLQRLLSSEHFRDHIQDVRGCYISNKGGQQFINDVSQCTLGILYHTKTRGTINVTDVTNSLYDEELDTLKNMLGQDKVIVVIDDLEDSSDWEKDRILKNQPSIEQLASDLLLFTYKEKADNVHLIRKLRNMKHFQYHSGKDKPKPTSPVFYQDRTNSDLAHSQGKPFHPREVQPMSTPCDFYQDRTSSDPAHSQGKSFNLRDQPKQISRASSQDRTRSDSTQPQGKSLNQRDHQPKPTSPAFYQDRTNSDLAHSQGKPFHPREVQTMSTPCDFYQDRTNSDPAHPQGKSFNKRDQPKQISRASSRDGTRSDSAQPQGKSLNQKKNISKTDAMTGPSKPHQQHHSHPVHQRKKVTQTFPSLPSRSKKQMYYEGHILELTEV